MTSTNARNPRTLLVTGGAGFIGSSFIRVLLANESFEGCIVNLDLLTYAGNLENLSGHVDSHQRSGRYTFVRGDIRDRDLVERLLREHQADMVVHFAAESHVDRSIHGPKDFIETNVVGTFAILEAVRALHAEGQGVHLHHVSHRRGVRLLGDDRLLHGDDAVRSASSPYSASKAASDHLRARLRAHLRSPTHGLQLLEQLRSLPVSREAHPADDPQLPRGQAAARLRRRPERPRLAVRGRPRRRDMADSSQRRRRAPRGTSAAATSRRTSTCSTGSSTTIARLAPRDPAALRALITYVKDRPGHDRRYAIDCSKIERELGWTPKHDFASGLESTVRWYLDHGEWIARVKSGAYREWLDKNYAAR